MAEIMTIDMRPDQIVGMERIVARYRMERGEVVSAQDLLSRALAMLREGKAFPLIRIDEFIMEVAPDDSMSKDEFVSAVIRRGIDALLASYARLPVRLWEPYPQVSTDDV